MNNEQNQVQFEESQFGQDLGQMGGQPPRKGLQDKLIDLIVKLSGGSIGRQQALYILLGVIGLLFVVSLIVIFIGFKKPVIEEEPEYYDGPEINQQQ